MLDIIAPSAFKTVPWKNGKGETVEMTINPGGTLDDFDWRLSMASVVENGEFSNFSGYTRNLILIKGDGINLQHNDSKIDRLSQLLDFATFDGGDKTVGNLHTGAITDFNVIARTSHYHTKVNCHQRAMKITVEKDELCFVYSLSSDIKISFSNNENNLVAPQGHLVKLSNVEENTTYIDGENIIMIYLNSCD